MQIKVFEEFIAEKKRAFAKTHLPYFVIATPEQKGNSFGERLYQAFASIFAQGYNRVIVVGNDCPELKAPDLLKSEQLLQNNEVVLGPDTSGGIYLLGLTKEAFSKIKSFDQVRWQTSQVYKDCKAFLAQLNLSQATLSVYHNINTKQELKVAFNRKFFSSQLHRVLSCLLAVLIKPVRVPFFYNPQLIHTVFFFRGPPVQYHF